MYIFLALFFAFLSASEVPGQPYFNGDGALVLASNDFENFTADPELEKARADYLYDKFLNDPQWHHKFFLEMIPTYNLYINQCFSEKSEKNRLMLQEKIIAMYPTALFEKCSGPKCPYSDSKVEEEFIGACSDALADSIKKRTNSLLHVVLYASRSLATEGRILLKVFEDASLTQFSKNLIIHCIDPIYESVDEGVSKRIVFVKASFRKLLKKLKAPESNLKIEDVTFNRSVKDFFKLLATPVQDSKDKEYYINPSLLVFGIDFDHKAYLKTGSVSDLQELLGRYQDASVVLALQKAPRDISIVKARADALVILQKTQDSLSGSLTKNTKLFIKFTGLSMVMYILAQQYRLPFSVRYNLLKLRWK
jgi:hypothetical protein